MEKKKLQHYFLLALLGIVGLFAFFILRPFIYIIILSVVCVTVFDPVHKRILRAFGDRERLAAFASTALVVFLILLPLIFLAVRIFLELQQFYGFLTEQNGKDAIVTAINSIISQLQINLPAQANTYIQEINADQYINQGFGWAANYFAVIFGSVAKLLFNFFIFLIVTYYAFKDGKKFKKIVIHASPLANTDEDEILQKITVAINSVVKGSLVVAFTQGVLAAIGFAIFGVPNILLWGTAVAVASLIPVLGTSLVLVPVIIFVFLAGHPLLALGLLVWSVFVVGLVDNFLRMILVGNDIKIHPLVVFLSVIGGLAFFGPIGVLLGPLAASLLFALVDIYISFKKTETI